MSIARNLSILGSIPQNTQSGNYQIQSSDAGGHIFHPSSDNVTARIWTIPDNTLGTNPIAFALGTTLTFINDSGASNITIQMNTADDILMLGGSGTTGARTLNPGGMATAVKITPTKWIINGAGLSLSLIHI